MGEKTEKEKLGVASSTSHRSWKDRVFGSPEEMKGFAKEPVPLKFRKGGYALTSVWWGWIWYIGGPLYGALNTAGWPFWAAIGLLFVGNWILAFFNLGVGLVGSRQGLSVSMSSRYSFGNVGTYIPSILYFFTLAGWFGVSIGILANVLATNIGSSAFIWSLSMGIVMTFLAIAGMRLISWLANLTVPIMFLLMVAGMVLAINESTIGWGGIAMASVPGAIIPWTLSIGLIVSHWIVGSSLAPDVSRWAKGDRVVAVSSLSAFGLSNPFIMALGVITAIAMAQPDLFTLMPKLGAGQPWQLAWFGISIICILLIVWTSGDCQTYTSGLALSNLTGLPTYITTAISGILGIILAVSGIAFQLINWLLLLGVFIPPITGIMIADYFFIHRQKYPHPSAISKYVNPAAIVAYFVSVGVEYYLQNYMGYAGIPVVNGLLLSIVLYVILMKATGWRNWAKDSPDFRSYPPGWPEKATVAETPTKA